ncbi:hypothetical protein NM208_g818 [Fusarium decemcellulare]|uniref:Uncharacterized protein n=1 Tax=Fusarium decemcellulare TaxID=57161 RepID=A0ACC1SY09_9HYPO|nr:hypothetical protein NM208_g818 [Fusarium decemcellulare]
MLKMMPTWKLLVSGVLAVTSMVPGAAAQYPNPGVVTGNTGVHDPTVVKTPGGSYIMAHTGANVALKTSSDRTAWRDAGAVFPNGAPWTTTYTKGDTNLWAPDISYHDGKYLLYYSATTGASGSWTNQGLVISSTESNDYNAIDPNLIIDASGKWWLSFGSFWSGIKLIQIDPSTGKRTGTNMVSLARRTEADGAVEAPFITRRGNYYYLWVITGPYVDKSGRQLASGGGTEVLASHGSIHGPGHNAVFTDNDADVLVYHYYTDAGDSRLGINLIRYESDWPVVY